jgi:glycosyltransferase involved in cell wall biosynthesis
MAAVLRPDAVRPIVIIPAHNESENLPFVLEELRASLPHVPMLVVDDGSTDGTTALLEGMHLRHLRLHSRIGVGGAVRAAIRYARAHGFNMIVRLDGDGQHRPEDIARLLEPILAGRAAATRGSRYTGEDRPKEQYSLKRLAQHALALCMSIITGTRITDPTSGFWAFGPDAVALLEEHHPTGYPEPELVLFLRRNGLAVEEVPVRMRVRRSGRSSLTLSRGTLAGARVLLALLLVPMRKIVKVPR